MMYKSNRKGEYSLLPHFLENINSCKIQGHCLDYTILLGHNSKLVKTFTSQKEMEIHLFPSFLPP